MKAVRTFFNNIQSKVYLCARKTNHPLIFNVSKIGIDIEKAKQILQQGGSVAIPTETVYGLAANGLDENAVLKIFAAKNRPYFDPLILHTNSCDKVKDYVTDFPDWATQLANAFW